MKDSNSEGGSDGVAWSSEEKTGGLSSCVSCTKAVNEVVEAGIEVLVEVGIEVLVEVGIEVLVEVGMELLVEVGMEVLVEVGVEVGVKEVVEVVVEVKLTSAIGAEEEEKSLAGDRKSKLGFVGIDVGVEWYEGACKLGSLGLRGVDVCCCIGTCFSTMPEDSISFFKLSSELLKMLRGVANVGEGALLEMPLEDEAVCAGEGLC